MKSPKETNVNRKGFSFVCGCLTCACVCSSLAATDGTLVNYGAQTANAHQWLDGVKASDGGVLFVDGNYGSPSHYVTFSTDMTLGGIECLNRGLLSFTPATVTLTMTGNTPTVREFVPLSHSTDVGSQFDRRAGWFRPKLVGTGDNTLVKAGGAKLMIQQPITGFREVYVKDGGLVATNVGPVITDCPVRLAGFLGYQPNYLTTGGDFAASCAAGGLMAEPGAQISVNKVNANTAALTVGPLARTEGGSLLLRSTRGTSSALTLGKTEKVLTSGSVPQTSKGLVAPWIAAREVAEPGTPVHFLAYDATNGFLPFSQYLTEFATSTSADLVRIASSTTVASAATAAAVEVDNANQLVVNAKLSLGDGMNPGALALNSTGTANQTFAGTGTVDFGDKPGLVWRGAASGVLTVKTKIAGTAGVTFTSGGAADSGTESPQTAYLTARPVFELPSGYLADLSGNVHIANCSFRFYRGSFGANDVYLEGGNRYGYASLEYWDYVSGSITNHFYVRGDYAFNIPGAKAGNGWIFDAPVTLTGDAVFNTFSQFFQFNRPIGGVGDLTIVSGHNAVNGNHSRFCAANTYQGATHIEDKGAHWLTADGTFGTGPVTVDETSSVVFDGSAGYAMTQAYACLGSTEIRAANLSFLGKTAVAQTIVTDTTTLGIGTDVTLGQAVIGSATVQADAPKSRLTLDGESSVAATFVAEGGKSLEIVKTGAGTATLARPMSGVGTSGVTLRVEEGTVRVETNPLQSPACVLWLDADDDACVKMSDGSVESLTSKAVMPHKMTYSAPNANFDRFLRTGNVNGHRALKPVEGKSVLYGGERAVSARTVFIAHRPSEVVDLANLFGSADGDVGIRSDDSASKDTHRWQNKIGHTSYKQGADNIYMYVNGEKGSGYAPGETQVLALRIPQSVTDNVRITPRLLRYSNADYRGEIGEVIVFDSELTDDEFAYVNNYLMAKWMGRAAESALPDVQVLPTDTELELTTGTTLDLNGTHQTIAVLTGKGSVVNTAGRPATLTVTGAFDASVKVGANITLVHGGNAKYAVYNDGPVTNGLAYWLDASHGETVKCDENGCVTNWISRGGTVGGLLNDGKTAYSWETKISAPLYVAEDQTFCGRPSVQFAKMTDGLWSDSAAKARTVFILKYDADGWTEGGNPYAWGVYDNSKGLVFSNANNSNGGLTCPNCLANAYFQYDDRFRVTKADGMVGPAAYGGGIVLGASVGQPYVVSFRIDEHNDNWATDLKTRLGATAGIRPGRFQSVGEVLVYERALSDGEMDAVEGYLVSKWITSPAIPAENDKVVLTGTVEVPIRADGSAATISVEGDLDASAAKLLVTNVNQAPKLVSLPLVDVSGSIVEGFGLTESDNKKFVFSLIGSKYLGKLTVPGLLVIFH